MLKKYKEQLKTWFSEKILLHNKNILTNYKYKKGEIWYVDFGINIGNEFNKIRPAVILTSKKFTNGNNVLVAPVTTYNSQKNILHTDVIIEIKNKSIVKINHMRDISKKRLLKKIGRVSDENLKEIDTNLRQIFDIRE